MSSAPAPADLEVRLAHVEARLAYELDIVAAAEAVEAGEAVLVDTRRRASWDHGHIAGALHLPSPELDARIGELPRDRTLVVYGWGPGCNGATATARTLLAAGLDVRELLGGYEYWVRNGFPTEAAGVVTRATPDPLVTADDGTARDH
ncbi:rhodanese-like domain-containing protein [Leifsonia sp. F6_8S_P_1B]|uniref:Rhodanese-like domain-containing protein n=1 Tax=Leifsonia williamsii TaxID=3035919 RepID=A0ABT8KC18_9MICO|nr:rhodanese-like domain-containing protein [Leifsonia williamsii]MDN4615004.1 rhodanese-like domain-containing protein [Leifsonia williamsii]